MAYFALENEENKPAEEQDDMADAKAIATEKLLKARENS